MKSIKDRVKYQGVAVPVPMIEEMKNFVIKHNGYRSVSEFVRSAIREKMYRESH